MLSLKIDRYFCDFCNFQYFYKIEDRKFFHNYNFKFSAISADFSFGPKNPKVYHTEIVSPSKGVDGFFVNFQKRSLCSQMAIGIVGAFLKNGCNHLLRHPS